MGIGPISGFESYGGLYGNYRMQNIPMVDVETVRAQDAGKVSEGVAGSASQQSPEETSGVSAVSENRASRIANLEDISLTFNKEDDFGYIGSESALGQLDMEKAISDMKKDSILEQYQYFVGNQGMNVANTVDGSVFMK